MLIDSFGMISKKGRNWLAFRRCRMVSDRSMGWSEQAGIRSFREMDIFWKLLF